MISDEIILRFLYFLFCFHFFLVHLSFILQSYLGYFWKEKKRDELITSHIMRRGLFFKKVFFFWTTLYSFWITNCVCFLSWNSNQAVWFSSKFNCLQINALLFTDSLECLSKHLLKVTDSSSQTSYLQEHFFEVRGVGGTSPILFLSSFAICKKKW